MAGIWIIRSCKTPFPVNWLTYNCCEDEHADQVTGDGKHVPEIDQGNTNLITIQVCSPSLALVLLFENKEENWKNTDVKEHWCLYMVLPYQMLQKHQGII